MRGGGGGGGAGSFLDAILLYLYSYVDIGLFQSCFCVLTLFFCFFFRCFFRCLGNAVFRECDLYWVFPLI